ncbi:pentatricopeptide repeat-containing protein At5g27110-like [Wolffia australiana]
MAGIDLPGGRAGAVDSSSKAPAIDASRSSSTSSDSSSEDDFFQLTATAMGKPIAGDAVDRVNAEPEKAREATSSSPAEDKPPSRVPSDSSGRLLGLNQSPVAGIEGYDPNRIPASVFARPKPAPGDWSTASNESLFSIQMGNSSFSREHAFFFGRSGDQADYSSSPPPEGSSASAVRSTRRSGEMSLGRSVNARRVSSTERANAQAMKDVLRAVAEERAAATDVRPDGAVHSPRSSDASSIQSFAFPMWCRSSRRRREKERTSSARSRRRRRPPSPRSRRPRSAGFSASPAPTAAQTEMESAALAARLTACAAAKLFGGGFVLHQKAVVLGLLPHPAIARALVELYLAGGRPAAAALVFSGEDVPLWNGLLSRFSRLGLHRETRLLFQRLRRAGHPRPDGFSFPSVLKSCPSHAGELHALAAKAGCLADPAVASAVVAAYARRGLPRAAARLFDEMPHRDTPSWNTLISCYYQHGQPAEALAAFRRLRSAGEPPPDAVTFTAAISACARLPPPAAAAAGRAVHGELLRRGIPLDAFLGSALIELYGKAGRADDARDVFDRVRDVGGVVCWNSMIGAAAAGGGAAAAVSLLQAMAAVGVPPTATTLSSLLMACARSADLRRGRLLHGFLLRRGTDADDVFVAGSLMEMYFKCARPGSARRVLETARAEAARREPALWNAAIAGLAAAGEPLEALAVYRDMEARPDAATFACALPACAQLAALGLGRETHRAALAAGLGSDPVVMGAALDMYAKCGAVDQARAVFDALPSPDLVAWTAIVGAYGAHGGAPEALRLFRRMRAAGVVPDRVAFLAAISACSHGGLVEPGCRLFEEMKEAGLEPGVEHYSCLADLLGRAGRLDDALRLVREAPADAGMLGSLVAACRQHRALAAGERLAGLLAAGGEEEMEASLVAAANMYAAAGRWEEVRRARAEMKAQRLKKTPGCSWVELDGQIQQFFVGDFFSHAMASEIRHCLAALQCHMGKTKNKKLV